MDWYESENWPANPMGAQVADVILRPFAERHFPKALHPLAHQMVTSLYPDFVFEAHGMKRPNPLLRPLVRAGFKFGLVISEKIAPDPRALTARDPPSAQGRNRTGAAPDTQRAEGPTTSASACPVHVVAAAEEASRTLDEVSAS